MRLLPRRARLSAQRIAFGGNEIGGLDERGMARLRGDRMAMIFQEPMTSLNPAYTIGSQMTEVLRRHRGVSRANAAEQSVAMLERVGVTAPSMRLGQFPHQLSGGLRQRVMIATALLCEPELLIADEPTTALDVTVQAQILRLLKDIQRQMGLAVLLITHDLGVVARVADRVSVMYAGRIVEHGSARSVFAAPHHPYTRGLLACIPVPGRVRRGEKLEAFPASCHGSARGFPVVRSATAARRQSPPAPIACRSMWWTAITATRAGCSRGGHARDVGHRGDRAVARVRAAAGAARRAAAGGGGGRCVAAGGGRASDRHRRRVRLRQVHPGTHAAGVAAGKRWGGADCRAGFAGDGPPGPRKTDPAGVSGPDEFAQPTAASGRHRRPAAARAGRGALGLPPARGADAGAGGPGGGHGGSVPVATFRWAAPARGDRAGAGRGAADPDLR